jgi:hypothetical protein
LLTSGPWAMQLPRIGGVLPGDVLHGDPVIGREGVYGLPSVEPPDSGVLLAAKRAERQIVHRLIVHMRHPRFETLGETHPRSISPVKTALDSPYGVSFARWRACASPLARISGATGPKSSSRARG